MVTLVTLFGREIQACVMLARPDVGLSLGLPWRVLMASEKGAVRKNLTVHPLAAANRRQRREGLKVVNVDDEVWCRRKRNGVGKMVVEMWISWLVTELLHDLVVVSVSFAVVGVQGYGVVPEFTFS